MSLENIYKQKFEKCLEINKEVGFVEKIIPPIVYVRGLPEAKVWEVVYFEEGYMGVIKSLEGDLVEVLVFTDRGISVGEKVSRSGEILQVPVGDTLLGQIVNPLCIPLQENMLIPNLLEKRVIDVAPPGVDRRERVSEPLETGVSMVDFLIPLGKGQRELVIGDRNIGKTTFVLQAILSQVRKGCICIYAPFSRFRPNWCHRPSKIASRPMKIISHHHHPIYFFHHFL